MDKQYIWLVGTKNKQTAYYYLIIIIMATWSRRIRLYKYKIILDNAIFHGIKIPNVIQVHSETVMKIYPVKQNT